MKQIVEVVGLVAQAIEIDLSLNNNHKFLSFQVVMSDSNELFDYVYVLGMLLIVCVCIDYFWYRPFQENFDTEYILKQLNTKSQRLKKCKGSRAILMTVENDTIPDCLLSISTIRGNGCKLPIIIYYTKLSAENQSHVEKFGVKTEYIDCNESYLVANAILSTSYQQILIVNPRLLFFQSPEYLFGDTQFQSTGALFWKDAPIKKLGDGKTYNWVRKLISYRTADNTILAKESATFQSRDIIVIDKQKQSKTLDKLQVLVNNWDVVCNYLNGDKELFWMAAELAKANYHFVHYSPGIIGDESVDGIKGCLLYSDSQGGLLCWKNTIGYDMVDFKYYGISGNWFSENYLKGCESIELTADIKNFINRYAQNMHEIKNVLHK